MNSRSINLGITEKLIQQSSLYQGMTLARVIAQYKDLYKIATEDSEFIAEISGKIRHNSADLSDYPAVGDFVMADRDNDLSGNAIIHHILPRKSTFIRRAAGTGSDVQVIAANIHTVFICMSLNNDFNLRRLERYLAIAWDSGATPVIVLTKSDLCDELPVKLIEIENTAIGADIVVTSTMTDDGYTSVLKYITPGQTVAFIGSSGVGKSSLINRLIGEDRIKTSEIRQDDRGRHTTTRRELIIIPSGGAVIDTPGMRELGVDSVDLAKTFADIDELSSRCRFSDCQHDNEPGCEVRRAIEEGSITAERLVSYNKLKKEAKYDGLNSKQIEKEKLTVMLSEFDGVKNFRDYKNSKKKRN